MNRPSTIVISDWLASCQVGQWTPFEAATALKAALAKEGYLVAPTSQSPSVRPGVEQIARIIYDAFPFTPRNTADQKPEWVPNGNSYRQDDARKAARFILALIEQPAVPGVDGVREALEWYAGEAEAAARYMSQSKATTADALLAILTVLANDGGRRARAILALRENDGMARLVDQRGAEIVGPACACCKQQPRADCDNLACAFRTVITELAEGHLALDCLGSPREIHDNNECIREYSIAERIAASTQRPELGWGSLVQLLLRAMDTSPRNENAAALAERMATAILDPHRAASDIGVRATRASPVDLLIDCYRSGQISEAQWQQHLINDRNLRVAWHMRLGRATNTTAKPERPQKQMTSLLKKYHKLLELRAQVASAELDAALAKLRETNLPKIGSDTSKRKPWIDAEEGDMS
jgi:hypothetical protein